MTSSKPITSPLSLAETALRVVALVVWLVVGSPTWLRFTAGWSARDAGWTALYLAFAALLWRTTTSALSRTQRVSLLLCQSACGVALALIGMPHFEGALLALVAAESAWFLPPAITLSLSFVQAVPLFIIVLPTHALLGAAKATSEYLAFALFATLVGYLRMQERAARRELGRERAVLLATQSLLEDGARLHERMRIAREVHDAIGHGLTAASINLELAAHTHDPEPLEAARAAVGTTLAELRGLVGTMRRERDISLHAALRALCAGIREPIIELDVPSKLALQDEARVHALFRCVQEAITNAMKHGAARHVVVRIEENDGVATATVRDDGVGHEGATFGNGLTGLRERLVELGGGLEVSGAPQSGKGFELRGWVPVNGGGT